MLEVHTCTSDRTWEGYSSVGPRLELGRTSVVLLTVDSCRLCNSVLVLICSKMNWTLVVLLFVLHKNSVVPSKWSIAMVLTQKLGFFWEHLYLTLVVGSIFPHAMEDVVLIVDKGIIQHYFKLQVNKGDVAWPPAHQSCSKSLYYCGEKRKISRNSPTPPKQQNHDDRVNLKPKKWVTLVLNTPHPYQISLTNVSTELQFSLTSFVPKRWENIVLSSPRTADVLNTSAATTGN